MIVQVLGIERDLHTGVPTEMKRAQNAVETADAVAVLTMQDRERFHCLFQEFAEKERLPLRFSRKVVSKRTRR